LFKTDGILICLGSNIKNVRENYWDFYDHHLPLSHVLSLCEPLRMHNFEVISVIPRAPLLFVRLYLKLPPLWRIFGEAVFNHRKQMTINTLVPAERETHLAAETSCACGKIDSTKVI
jgi:hypothetical protein